MSEKNSQVRWQESELNEAETKVLCAFRDGWKADDWKEEVVIREVFPDKPAEEQTVADWKGAVLRADFLRDLFLGNYGDFAPRRIKISRAWIEGTLYLDYCESNRPLFFPECIFAEGVFLAGATIPLLNLEDSKIRSDQNGYSLVAPRLRAGGVFLRNKFKADGEVDLSGANVGRGLECNGGTFAKGLMAPGLKAGAVFLGNKFKADGEVSLYGADVGGQVSCSGGTFAKGLMAPGLKAGAVFLGNKFKAGGEVSLYGADVGGQVSCSGGTFTKGLIAQGLKAGVVFLRNGFEAEGEVNLNGADVRGQVVCDGGTFAKGLIAPNLKASDVFLGDGFEAKGEVNLSGADVREQVACDGGTFTEGLQAQDLKVGDVFLRSGFEAKGEVNLNGADVGGHVACNGGTFTKGLIAPNLKAGDVFLRNEFKADGRVNLNGADISGSLELYDAEINSTIVLDNAKVDAFKLGLLGLSVRLGRSVSAEGFRYRQIEQPIGKFEKDTGDKWLGWISKNQFQPYEQLMAVYRRAGHANWARNVGFKLEDMRHKKLKAQPAWYLWYWVLRLTLGYGYKPFRSFHLLGSMLILGSVLFSSGHCWDSSEIASKEIPLVSTFASALENQWIPSGDEALNYWNENGKPPKDYPSFNPLAYSLDAIFPLDFGQLENWHPRNQILLYVRWALTAFGTLILALLALFGAGVLGPLWRSGDEEQ